MKYQFDSFTRRIIAGVSSALIGCLNKFNNCLSKKVVVLLFLLQTFLFIKQLKYSLSVCIACCFFILVPRLCHSREWNKPGYKAEYSTTTLSCVHYLTCFLKAFGVLLCLEELKDDISFALSDEFLFTPLFLPPKPNLASCIYIRPKLAQH